MKSRLSIDGTDVGFKSLLPISINMAVADVREPDKRNSAYSKTITIPGSKEVNQIFEYIFEVNIQGNSFNPNVKTPAAYYVNEVRVFNGDLQLLKVKKKYNGTTLEVNYECSIVGETGNLFLDISSLFLTDIDFSDLDHTLTYASGLFNPTLGEGYCYPYIDYGVNYTGAPSGATWIFEHLKPAIFEKEYIDRIFADAGYTYTSNYLNSTYAKSIIIPDVNEGRLKIPQATINSSLFYAGRTTDTSPINQAGTFSGLTYWQFWANHNFGTVPFNDDSTGDFFDDAANNYDTSTSVFTTPINAVYSFGSNTVVNISVNTAPAGTVNSYLTYSINWFLEKSTNGGASYVTGDTGSVSGTSILTSSQDISIGIYTPPIIQDAGTKFRIRLAITTVRFEFYDVSNTLITAGTCSADFKIKSTATFGNSIPIPILPYNGSVDMNSTIPSDIKQIDFLTSILKAENLYMEIDKDDPRNYIIEPREDFIQLTDPLDWTEKLDISKEIEIVPMGDLDAKRYYFTHKTDKDFYNQAYESEYKEVYGSETVNVDTDFVKTEKKIELVFSATPIAATSANDIVAPRLFTSEDLITVKPIKCNIRRLYWGGVISSNTHTLSINGSNTSVSEYPFAGHVDHPFSPTIDLNFGYAQKLYWWFPGQQFTNINRYNVRYSKFITEIMHRDSKIFRAYFYLNEIDISEFSFRKTVFVDNAYFFVNKISDYDPQEEKTILVEMLKLKLADVFSGGGVDPGDVGTARAQNYDPSGNYTNTNGRSIGTNNINNGNNSFVIGEGNVIG